MCSKTSIFTSLLVISLAACAVESESTEPLVTPEETQMIKETIKFFMASKDWKQHLINLRTVVLEKYPEYQSMLEKLHLSGTASEMTVIDSLHFMGYFISLSDGKMCPIKLDMQEKNIDLTPEDFDKLGDVIIEQLKKVIPDMSDERAAAWDALLNKLKDKYKSLGTCEDFEEDFDF